MIDCITIAEGNIHYGIVTQAIVGVRVYDSVVRAHKPYVMIRSMSAFIFEAETDIDFDSVAEHMWMAIPAYADGKAGQPKVVAHHKGDDRIFELEVGTYYVWDNTQMSMWKIEVTEDNIDITPFKRNPYEDSVG